MITKQELIGKWEMEKRSPSDHERIILEIKDDDTLIYTTLKDHQKQIIFLTYNLEDNLLITDQPSAPGIERTQVSFKGMKLIFNFEGEISIFNRIDPYTELDNKLTSLE